MSTTCDASEPTGAYWLGPRRSDILFSIEPLVELLSELLGLSDADPALGKSALYIDKSNGDTFTGVLSAVSLLLPAAVIAEVPVTATLFGTLLEYCTALSVTLAGALDSALDDALSGPLVVVLVSTLVRILDGAAAASVFGNPRTKTRPNAGLQTLSV